MGEDVDHDLGLAPGPVELGEPPAPAQEALVVLDHHVGHAEMDEPGGEAEVVIDIFTHEGDGLWRRSVSRQRHRHHPIEDLRAIAAESGLEVVAVLGQRPGAVLDEWLDESEHRKAVFVMRRGGRLG